MHLHAPVTSTRPAVSRRGGSPVRAAYTRLAAVLPLFSVVETAPGEPLPAGDGWTPAAALAAPGPVRDAFLAEDAAQMTRDFGGTPRPDVVAGFSLHRYAWPACLLFTVPWFLHRRVPDIPLDATAVRRGGGPLAVRVESFSCLPGDPAATLPGARVMPDEEALRARVREAVATHLGPLLEGFGPLMRRRGRALWGLATDEITEGLWYAGRVLGAEPRARADLRRLLPGGTAPFAGAAAFRGLAAPDGTALTTRDRASCCMFYTLRPQDTCVTCPRTCDAERISKLTATAA
ncbi:(2Fe-2S)-binding protein [Streptomyces sp. NPDC050560]|uniref:(2Fe-2S)-binding protein n=1 Tax=Streptomyces sp. NPDC050560 TaxID=3365630 RepID=UPI0037906152